MCTNPVAPHNINATRQGVFGGVGATVELSPADAAATAARVAHWRRTLLSARDGGGGGSSPTSSAPRDVRVGVHRSLLFLGDLAFFGTQAGGGWQGVKLGVVWLLLFCLRLCACACVRACVRSRGVPRAA
jgi:hypothetical protein